MSISSRLVQSEQRIARPVKFRLIATIGTAPRRTAVRLFAVAFVIRLAFVVVYPQFPITECDCSRYDEVGWNVATGRGFVGGFSRSNLAGDEIPDALEVAVGPVYPAFLGAVYWVFGHHLTTVRVAQALIGALTVAVLFLGVSAVCGIAVARLAALIVTWWPALIAYTGVVVTETLFTFLLVLLVFLLVRATHIQTVSSFAVAGAVMGLTILIREEAILLAIPFAGLILWVVPSRWGMARALVFLLAASLLVSGWTIRNYVHFRQVILVTAHGGDTLWISNKGWTEWNSDDPELRALVKGLTYVEQSDVLRRAAIREISAEPMQYLMTRARRFPDFWLSSHATYIVGLTGSFRQYYAASDHGRVALKLVLLAANCVLILLAFAGVILWIRGIAMQMRLAWFLVPIIGIATVHFFLFAAPRYLVPILPFLAVFAALQVAALFGRSPVTTHAEHAA